MKNKTPRILQTLGTIETSLYVIATIAGQTAVYVAHNNTAMFEYYSSVEGWIYTLAHDALEK